MEAVFLGVNDVGMRIYRWLVDREGVDVLALVTTEEQLALVEELRPDVVVSVGFDHLVPPEVLSVPPEGCINLHPSLLPYNRGKSPNVWSIIDGTPAGVTLHYMDEAFDSGDVIHQQEVETSFADTGRDLHERLERAQFAAFTEAWPDVESGTVEASPQPEGAGAYHSVDDFKERCEIDPSERFEAKELLDVLRALTFPPFDNAYVEVEGERYYVDVDIRPASEDRGVVSDGLLRPYR